MRTETTSRKGMWAAGGSVVAAAIASACCWLPLLLVGFGASAVGVSAAFERFRPYMLAAAVLLLGAGFYLVYFRKPACAPGEACAVPNPSVQRLNKLMLWAALLGVVAFGAFPEYAGLLADDGAPAQESSASMTNIALDVEGMTCEACTVHIQRELMQVPGVLGATVDYDGAKATVSLDASSPTRGEDLIGAVERAGYKARLQNGP